MSTFTYPIVLVLFAVGGCARDGAPRDGETDVLISETSPDETQLTEFEDTDTETEADLEVDIEIEFDAEVEDVVCPTNRVPLMRGGDVVDPCGCCAIGGEYCHGLLEGGSPSTITGECELVHDAVPPCTNGIDPRGCPTHSCSGSCIADE